MDKQINELLEVLKEYQELGISEQIDYQKFYLYSIITHSTAIEGSTVTEIENQLLFDEGITAKGKPIVEQLMNLDLKRAYEQSIRWAREHTQNLRNEILEYRKSMEEDIAIADIKVQMEGENKMEKEKQEVVQKGGPETRNAILQLIASNGNITSRKIASTLNINRSAISKHLKKMQEDHIIRREGSQKSGKWVIIS
jgi:uncharacterized membrane protein